jgi:hypothetical protein
MTRRHFAALVSIGVLVSLLAASAVQAAGEDFENLEFFLDQYLKESQDPVQRSQIIERYTVKALGLLYRQNAELIRLNTELLRAVQQLADGQGKDMRTLEYEIREMRNDIKGRVGSTAPSEPPPRGKAK